MQGRGEDGRIKREGKLKGRKKEVFRRELTGRVTRVARRKEEWNDSRNRGRR